MKLSVFHDGRFWVGVVEEQDDTGLKAARQIFGSEPKDTEILEFVNHRMMALLERTAMIVDASPREERKINPKRLQRQVAREMKQRGPSTKAQEALRLELESRKQERKISARERKKERAEWKRKLAILKRKTKHRGK
jgi:hypothetical protein